MLRMKRKKEKQKEKILDQLCGMWGGTGWYLVVLGQYRAVLVDDTGPVEGGTGCYLVVLDQNRVVLVASVIAF